jgi:hypothetical protein
MRNQLLPSSESAARSLAQVSLRSFVKGRLDSAARYAGCCRPVRPCLAACDVEFDTDGEHTVTSLVWQIAGNTNSALVASGRMFLFR